MNIIMRQFAFLLCWLFLGMFGVHAAESTNKVLKVGVSPNFAPMIYKEGKKIVGFEADMAEALGKELNRTVELVEVPWVDMIDALNEGKIDIIMSGMTITVARQTRVAFAPPYLKIGQMALVRADDKYRYYLGFSDLSVIRMGVFEGTTGDYLVRQEFKKAKRKTYDTGDDAANALLKKRIDLFISDAPVIYILSGKYEDKGLVVAPNIYTEELLAWGVRRSDAALLESVTRYLDKIRTSGQLNQSLKRWIPGMTQ